MVQTLARCRSCGLPAKLAERIEWRDGGIIVLGRMKSMRLAMLDAQTMESIHNAVAAETGEESITEAEKEYTRIVIGKLMAGIKGRLTRYGAIKKRVLEGMEEYSILLGMGRLEIEKFTPGAGGLLNLHEPFNISMVVAGVTGTLEEMDRCGYAAEITAIGANSQRLDLRVVETHGTKAVSRKPFPDNQSLKGVEKQQGCHLCGLPSFVSQLIWDELYGVVTAGVRGRRVALVPVFLLEAITDPIVEAGKGSRQELLEEAVYNATAITLEGGTGDAYESADLIPRNGDAQAAWDSLRMRGWGEVVGSSMSGESWQVDVAGVVNAGLVAGWLRALYAAATGEKASATIKEEREYITFKLD
ncbi:MAG: hypothetical protein JW854_12370 [Actinobacteria bacterium]|nr:hypothetical protein [Actinomycetota bacterium]